MAQGMLSLPEGFSSWDEYDKFKKQTGPSMRPSYSNRFTEAVATNPLTGLLVPGAEQFLQRGGRPSLLDAGLAAADVALPAIPLAGMVKKLKGVTEHTKLYHGSPSKELDEVSISKSKRDWMPHVSATDDPLLAKTFTKGELGDLPEGKVHEIVGDFKVIDIDTDEGRKIWDSLGRDPRKALDAGYDGVQFKNYEQLKVESFYPDIDWDLVSEAKEIQLFKDAKIKKL